MNKYVIAWCSLFDNVILQEVIEANSAPEAVIEYIRKYHNSFGWAEELVEATKHLVNDTEAWYDFIDEEVYNSDVLLGTLKL